MIRADLYAVLGVLPDAEDIVIVAAYRALAQRYHPDRWTGDSAEAHRRMSQINAAYAVLGDKSRRAEYDHSRQQSSQAEFASEAETDQAEAFTSALDDAEQRWAIACSIHSDLSAYRQRLARISTSLAFSYVVVLLDSKAYERRAEIAETMERHFLERYFGTDRAVVEYARNLVLAGQKQAAKALNRLVDVMGSKTPASLLIDRVERDFGLYDAREREQDIASRKARTDKLKSEILAHSDYEKARELAHEMGYRTQEVGGSFWTAPELVVITPRDESLQFKNAAAFIGWAQRALCARQ